MGRFAKHTCNVTRVRHALEVAGGENAELDVTVMMLKEKRDRVETEIDTNTPAQFS
jgi:hypothetical protein